MDASALLDVRLLVPRPPRLQGLVVSRSATGVALLADDGLREIAIAPSHPISLLERAGAIVLWPASWTAEGEEYRALVRGREALATALDALGPAGGAALRSVTQVDAPAALAHGLGALGSRLTKRQIDALDAAIARGYYEIPRRVEVGAIAREFGLGRATFQEHLRKAERVALHEIAPALALAKRLGGAGKGRGRPRRLGPLRS